MKDKRNPEVCTLNEYHRVFNPGEYDNVCSMCRNTTIGCTTCKKNLAEILYTLLFPIREKRKVLGEKSEQIQEILQCGSEKARTVGNKTLDEVKEAMNINISEH